MKAKDLAKMLLENPEMDICISMDISTNDDDSDRRVFGDDIREIVISQGSITILLDGVMNY